MKYDNASNVTQHNGSLVILSVVYGQCHYCWVSQISSLYTQHGNK